MSQLRCSKRKSVFCRRCECRKLALFSTLGTFLDPGVVDIIFEFQIAVIENEKLPQHLEPKI